MKLRANINKNVIIGASGKTSRLKDSSFHDSNKNLIISKPLNDKSHGPSFKGFSLNRVEKVFTKTQLDEALIGYSDVFGKASKEYAEGILDTLRKGSSKSVQFSNDGSIKFTEKSFIHTLFDSAVYPIVHMPVDIINYFSSLVAKKPLFSYRTKQLQELSDSKALQGIIDGYHAKKAKNTLSGMFYDGHGRLDPLKANYSSEAERALTRLNTGMVAAFFLANDAFNLSRLCDDDPAAAKKEKGSRFKQEVGRVGLTSYLTLVTLGALKKHINKSMYAAAGVVVGSAVISEFLGRVFAKKPILPLSAEKASKIAHKHDKEKLERKHLLNHYNPVASSTLGKTFAAFNGKSVGFEGKSDKKENNGGLLTKKNIGIALLAMLSGGFAIKALNKTNAMTKFTKNVSDWYKSLTKTDIKYSRNEFNKVTAKLESNGFEELAQSYKELIADQTGDVINLGKKDKKFLKPIADTFVFPFKFVYNFFMSPSKYVQQAYKSIVKDAETVAMDAVNSAFKKLSVTAKKEELEQVAKNVIEEKVGDKLTGKKLDKLVKKLVGDRNKKNQTTLSRSLDFIKKESEKAASSDDFKKRIAEKIFDSMDTTGKSNYSNADLAVLCKMGCSLLTSLFLISDNYNLVMLKSAGQDKNLAEQKAKERTIQRITRTFFSGYMIKTVNDLFKSLYNKSLLGTVVINSLNSSFYEGLTRKSVSLPIGESTRDEILELEEENMNAKGLKGKYFRFMSWLTGKKSLSQRIGKHGDKKQQQANFQSKVNVEMSMASVSNSSKYFQMLK